LILRRATYTACLSADSPQHIVRPAPQATCIRAVTEIALMAIVMVYHDNEHDDNLTYDANGFVESSVNRAAAID
jgi:hypothetical protein